MPTVLAFALRCAGSAAGPALQHSGHSDLPTRLLQRPGAGWVCPRGRGGVRKKKGPEVRISGGPPDRFKEETSSFTALFRGSWRTSLDSSSRGSGWGCQGEMTSRGWDSSCAQTREVGGLARPCAGPCPEETDQVATGSPPAGSWPSEGSARWVQSHSDHAGVCPSLGLAT